MPELQVESTHWLEFNFEEMTAGSHGFLRVAAVAPTLKVSDVSYNSAAIIAAMESSAKSGASVVLFPELSLTGYSCGDLFGQSLLLSNAWRALEEVATAAGEFGVIAVVGLPVALDGRLYNCAAMVGDGCVLGLVPKSYLPTSGEYYERRWFASGVGLPATEVALSHGKSVMLGTNLLFVAENLPNCVFGIEICEDLWAVTPPSGEQALAGATLLLNPSASNELLGKSSYRRDLVRLQSARCLAAYVYASAGPGESSTDVVFSGHCLIAENGAVLAESERFHFLTQSVFADIDLERLQHERLCNTSFSSSAQGRSFQRVPLSVTMNGKARQPLGTLRPNPSSPFVPSDPGQRATACREIFDIQSTGLAKRLRHTAAKSVVIGISGGLDSTLALLVVTRAFDTLGLDRKGLLAVTMPGFGTTQRTRSNAEKLVLMLGATLRVVPIHDAVSQHFRDIGHDPAVHDVTYENAQARERTQILMDLANKTGGFVVGTGDLSEAALGWCTFNGDQMSMYHVNVGIPKTLVRYLVAWCADAEFQGAAVEVLRDICATPVTPELLPAAPDGTLQQRTESLIGPYELHDYFLFHLVRYGSRPAKILCLAEMAFRGRYDRATIIKWLTVFVRRFFSQQFKRSVQPDGPKVGSVALSPRGDWRMPSDASATEWLTDVESLSPRRNQQKSRKKKTL